MSSKDQSAPGTVFAEHTSELPPPSRRSFGIPADLDLYFGISAKGSTLSREVFAGVSTFLALSYIFVVNPAILSQAGMSKSGVLFATIVTSGLATITMGLWARLPFVVAPGMEMNAYVAFYAIIALGFTWQQALGMVFWSSVIMVGLTIASIRERIIDSIPVAMRVGLAFSVGVFLMLIALSISGVLKYDGVTFKGIGDFRSPAAYALYFGVLLVLILDRLRIPGAVLISIIITAGLCHGLGIGSGAEMPTRLSATMFDSVGMLDLNIIMDPKSIGVVLVLFVLDFYGSVAKFIGLTLNTNIMEDGKVPRRKEALLVDGGWSVAGAILGTTSVITYVESAVGIGMGARTGVAAVTCGLLMLTCFLVAPFLHLIPVAATTGALVFVGIKLCPPRAQVRGLSRVDLAALIIMPLVVIATFAIDRAMLAGFAIYLVAGLIRRQRLDPFLLGSTVLMAISTALQFR